MEIERKWLLCIDPKEAGNLSDALFRCCASCVGISQRYIDDTNDRELRIRKIQKSEINHMFQDRYELTEKTPTDRIMARNETTIQLPQSIGEYIYNSIPSAEKTHDVIKTRYSFKIGTNLVLELDLYSNLLFGLVTAEIEFNTVEEAEQFSWFRLYDESYVPIMDADVYKIFKKLPAQEITGLKTFNNRTLSNCEVAQTPDNSYVIIKR